MPLRSESVEGRAKGLLWSVAALVWAASMFGFSTERYDGQASRSILIQVAQMLSISATPETVSLLNGAFRKAAHFTEYAILSALVFKAAAAQPWSVKEPRRAAMWSLVLCAIYACTDEIHQAFVANRHARAADWILDVIGAVAGLAVCYAAMSPSAEQTGDDRLLRLGD